MKKEQDCIAMKIDWRSNGGLSEAILKNNCLNLDSKNSKGLRKNLLTFPPNPLMTQTQMSQSAMMSRKDNAKNLAYVNLKMGTPHPSNTSVRHDYPFCIDFQSNARHEKDIEDLQDHVTRPIITSEKGTNSSDELNDIHVKSSKRSSFSKKKSVTTINDMSSNPSFQSVKSSFIRPNHLSTPDENIRSFLVAISNVTKKGDTISVSSDSNSQQGHGRKTKKSSMTRKSTCNKKGMDMFSTSSKSFNGPFSASSPEFSSNPRISPGLTLSAFRRPEVSVRLTDCPEDRFIHQTYHVRRVLGHGASSTVRLAFRRSDGKRFAVKYIPKYTILRERHRLDETALLRALDHPNIVCLVDVFESENEVQLIFEYCDGGELFDAVLGKKGVTVNPDGSKKLVTKANKANEGYSEKDAAKIVSSLLRALRYLHFLGIVHRDVKPENVLLKSSENGDIDVKLSDFGTARALHPQGLPIVMNTRKFGPFLPGEGGNSSPTRRSRAYSRVGSDYYTAPEVHSGKGYDTSADLYSLGVTMYIILFGKFPTIPLDMTCLSDPNLKQISPEAKDLLLHLLNSDPKHRITAAEALKHDWIESNNNIERKRCSSSSLEGGIRKMKKRRTMEIVDAPFFSNSDLYNDNDAFVMIDEREEDGSSRELLLRPICYV